MIRGVEGGLGRRRPRRGLMDEVVSVLGVRGLTVEQTRATVHDRKVERGLINGV